jgi:hypothetical protein
MQTKLRLDKKNSTFIMTHMHPNLYFFKIVISEKEEEEKDGQIPCFWLLPITVLKTNTYSLNL